MWKAYCAGEKALKEVLKSLGLLNYQIELQLLQVHPLGTTPRTRMHHKVP